MLESAHEAEVLQGESRVQMLDYSLEFAAKGKKKSEENRG